MKPCFLVKGVRDIYVEKRYL